jgi:hypothetical protein
MLCLVYFPDSNLVIRAEYFNIFPDTSSSIGECPRVAAALEQDLVA